MTRSHALITRLRRSLRLLLASCLYYSGLIALHGFLRRKAFRRREICVLGLHRVLSEEERVQSNSLHGMVLKEETFGGLLEYLRRSFTVMSLETFLEHAVIYRAHKRPPCLLTFDDGWRDTYTRALPCLKRFGIPATVFVTTGYVGSPDASWVERLSRSWEDSTRRSQIRTQMARVMPNGARDAEFEEMVECLKHMAAAQRDQLLAELLPVEKGPSGAEDVDRMLRWEQLIAMSNDGVQIGAHTVTHPLLTFEDDTVIERELRGSKEALEARLGKAVYAFAYPNGDWNERVRQWVVRTGYRCAFTTQRGWHRIGGDLFTVRRILLHEGNVTGWGGRFSPAALGFTLARGR